MNKRSMAVKILMAFLAAAMLLAPACSGKKSGGEKQAAQDKAQAARKAVPVQVTPAEAMLFQDTVTVQGSIEARDFANVSAKIPGTLEAIFVKEGDPVVAGQTPLFSVDSEKLGSVVQIKRQDLEVGRHAVLEARAGLEQVDAQLRKAEVDLKRITNLYEQDVVSKDDLEKVQTGHAQLVAARKYSASVIGLAQERQKQAAVALQISEKDYRDATVYAPISGYVSYKFAEVGEMAAPGIPVIQISDPAALEASAFLPAEYYPRIKAGTTLLNMTVAGLDLDPQPVSYVSPTINPKLRTFEVKCVIAHPESGVAPGVMVDVTAILDSRQGLGAPANSVQHRGADDVVFIVDDKQTAQLVPIVKGLEQNGMVEIAKGRVSPGDRIVIQGQNFLEQGQPVQVRGEAE